MWHGMLARILAKNKEDDTSSTMVSAPCVSGAFAFASFLWRADGVRRIYRWLVLEACSAVGEG
jgi:hypothetical protein